MKQHSKVGIITNSSTEIFTYINDDAAEIFYNTLQKFFEAAGSRLDARKVFDIKIIREEGWDSDYKWDWEHGDKEEYPDLTCEEYVEMKYQEDQEARWECWGDNKKLVVTVKATGEVLSFSGFDPFYREARYEG